MILIFTLVGAGGIVGLVAGRIVEPSKADVRAGARSLVPQGLDIIEDVAGHQGNAIPRGIYVANIETSGGGNLDDRSAAVRRQAERAGWRLVKTDPGNQAVELNYERDGVAGTVTVLGAELPGGEPVMTMFIMVAKQSVAARRTVSAGIGMLCGLGLALVVRGSRRPTSSDDPVEPYGGPA